jgi:AbrB family looped-hinge helix DNA binding protein
MPATTLTTKGQVTIPKPIREQLRLHTGQRLDFQVDRDGRLIVKPRARDIRELKGILRSDRKKPVSIAEMHEAIAQGSQL